MVLGPVAPDLAQVRRRLPSASLLALYPVVLHFAGDPFDVASATDLAVGAALAAWQAIE